MDKLLVDYMICKECRNPNAYYGTCLKCGKCGRKFEDGVLINGNEYPGYDPESEDEDVDN